MQSSTDQFNIILQSEATENFQCHKMCILSLGDNRCVVPTQLFISAGGPSFPPRSFPAELSVANHGIQSDVRCLWWSTTGSIQESKRYLQT